MYECVCVCVCVDLAKGADLVDVRRGVVALIELQTTMAAGANELFSVNLSTSIILDLV